MKAIEYDEKLKRLDKNLSIGAINESEFNMALGEQSVRVLNDPDLTQEEKDLIKSKIYVMKLDI